MLPTVHAYFLLMLPGCCRLEETLLLVCLRTKLLMTCHLAAVSSEKVASSKTFLSDGDVLYLCHVEQESRGYGQIVTWLV